MEKQTGNHADELQDDSPYAPPDQWHVVRGIPVALIIAIGVQSGGAIWWASGLSAKLDRAIEQIQEFRQDRYTKDDGRRDQQLMIQMMESFRQTDRELERRLISCEQHNVDARGNGVRAR